MLRLSQNARILVTAVILTCLYVGMLLFLRKMVYKLSKQQDVNYNENDITNKDISTKTIADLFKTDKMMLYYVLSILLFFGFTTGVLFFMEKVVQKRTENFWDVTPAAQCKGGPYMWQGNSDVAKMCREMSSTPEGRCAISSYNCPTGQIGTPKMPFFYTPLSDDGWSNQRCTDRKPCPCVDAGLCAETQQVPQEIYTV